MSDMPSKPREFWIRPDEPFGGEHICPHPIPINEGYDFFQKEAVHVVEHSALVAAQAEIVDTVHRAQDTIIELKTEIERLTNQYNEQLDLVRHRAVELEKAKITYDANLEERLEMRAELERANTSLLDMTMDRDRFKKRHAEQKEQADELELMAENYRAILSKLSALTNYKIGYVKPVPTGEDLMSIIDEARAALSGQGEKE